ncbi:hypothetical protein BJF83_23600 [Nocardiopsis sp. CNR-923]|nr:hypothetical protein BJF83_23600 [Nocardiopsis sp. CNR-923]
MGLFVIRSSFVVVVDSAPCGGRKPAVSVQLEQHTPQVLPVPLRPHVVLAGPPCSPAGRLGAVQVRRLPACGQLPGDGLLVVGGQLPFPLGPGPVGQLRLG